jgi:hypothetical protein
LREGMSRCRTKSFGCVRKEQTKQHISSWKRISTSGLRDLTITVNDWRLDIMHDKELTMTGKITSPILVAHHLGVTFCKQECPNRNWTGNVLAWQIHGTYLFETKDGKT